MSKQLVDINEIDEFLLECDCFDGRIMNGLKKRTLDSFALDRTPGCKIVQTRLVIQYKDIKKLFLLVIIFFEDVHNVKLDSKDEKLTSFVSIIKI